MTDATTSEKPNRTWSDARRRADQERRRRGNGQAGKPGISDLELNAEEVIGDAVGNVITMAGYLLPIAPYTAVTIMGVPDPEDPKLALVRSRAQMAGAILLEHAKQNPRVLAAVHRFNLLFTNVEALECAAAVVASVAVDAKLVPAEATIALPGGHQFPVLAPAIGDTIDYLRDAQVQPDQHTAERRTRRTEGADGVEAPQDPWPATQPGQSDPTPEQLAAARAARERRAKRDEAIANGQDPTSQKAGQVVVPGGVADT